MSADAITPLRQRMIEDMSARKLIPTRADGDSRGIPESRIV